MAQEPSYFLAQAGPWSDIAVSDEAAFLQKIRENLDDDAPRLIFADWLEEHGETDRAEFIRLECEIESMMIDRETAPEKADNPRFWKLEGRARKLYEKHGDRWFGALDKLAEHYETRRGFVDHIALPMSQFLRNAKAIFQVATLINDVIFTKVGRDLAPLAKCRQLANVERLCFFENWIGDKGLQTLAKSPYLTNLRELDVSQEVSIGAGGIGPKGAKALAKSPHLKRLEVLKMSGCDDLYDEGAIALLKAKHWTRLRELDLSSTGLTDQSVIVLAKSPHLRELKKLNLQYNAGIYAGGVEAIGGAAHLAGLRELFLSGNSFLDDDFEGDSFGDEGIEALARSPHLRQLQKLYLIGVGLTDGGAAALAASPILAGVTDLNLSRNSLGPAGVESLVDSPNLANLKEIALRHCHLSKASKAALQKRFGKKVCQFS